jgi:hypothetical protein
MHKSNNNNIYNNLIATMISPNNYFSAVRHLNSQDKIKAVLEISIYFLRL